MTKIKKIQFIIKHCYKIKNLISTICFKFIEGSSETVLKPLL